jgi:hypothetical protein
LCPLDLVEANSVDVDEMPRRLDLKLHQVEQIGSAGDELCVRSLLCFGRRFLGRAGAFVGECPHVLLPATSAIASAMLE